MEHIVSIMKVLLSHNLYYDDDLDDESDDAGNDDNLDSNGEENDQPSHQQEVKCSKNSSMKRLMSVKAESRPSETELDLHTSEPDLVFKSSMDNLADQISKLTLELT